MLAGQRLDGAAGLLGSCKRAHTRSTVVRPKPLNRPPGRSSSTRMTSRNTNAVRNFPCEAGRTSPSTEVAKPMAKPPAVALHSRSSPPTTAPTSATIVMSSPNVWVTSGSARVEQRDHRGHHPGDHERERDHAVRCARRAGARCGSRSAAARICSPIEVRSRISAVPAEQDGPGRDLDDRDPAELQRPPRIAIVFERREQVGAACRWRRTRSARPPRARRRPRTWPPASSPAPRRAGGRKANRSISHRQPDADDEAQR